LRELRLTFLVYPLRRLTCLFLIALLAGSTLTAKSTSPHPIKWMRGIYIAESPAPTPVSPALLFASAKIAAAAVDGYVLRGSGQSMQPLYSPSTVLVVAPTPFNSLKRGQTVLYRLPESALTAHVLIAKTGRGWRVAGLNNKRPDSTGVTADNLFGVVVAAFNPIEGNEVTSPLIPDRIERVIPRHVFPRKPFRQAPSRPSG